MAARTQGLLQELEWTRGDLLSVADLNRGLRVLLRNQVAIMRALVSAGTVAPAAPAAVTPLSVSVTPISVTPVATAPVAAAPVAAAPVAAISEEPARAPEELDLGASDSDEAAAVAKSAGSDEAAGSAETLPEILTRAVELLGTMAAIEGRLARELVAAFDHRDRDYDKGLEKLIRWTEGTGGTPFQLRGERAYLNVGGSSREGVQSYEQNLMKRMGFVRRLGRLVIPGLDGEVVIYERP
ncbi:MAG: hypothetical protein AB7N76_21855 [Planctomycetota bacterium]